ncbi:MAG: murein biosynthesis integral membrane protein MurJ [Chloroflexi bacterium]|nr:murein biosynthesis integral membrane protein MurJ [Chloroflexota bacterium]
MHPMSESIDTIITPPDRNTRLARAVSIVMVAFVASRALGVLRDVIVARQFGTTPEYGAYLAAFRVPDLLFQLIAGGALASAFVPAFSSYLARENKQEAWRMASALINLTLIVITAMAAISFVAAPLLARLIVPRYSPEYQDLTAHLMRWMLPSPIIFGVSGLVMGILNARQHFLLPAIAPIMYNLAIILAALVLAPTFGINGLVFGVVLGAVLHLLIQIPELRNQGMRYSLLLGLHEPGVREVGRLMGPRMIGLGMVQLNFLINTILASGLGPESIPALDYAWRTMLLPQGIFALALATAIFPTFSEQAAKGHIEDLRQTLASALRIVLFLTFPAAVGLIMLRVPLIQVLFQRGRFDLESTEAVAAALKFYALGLVGLAGTEILTRAFYAMHDTRTPVIIGALSVALNIALSLILLQPFGFPGLALSAAVAYTGEGIFLFLIMRRRLGGLGENRLMVSFGRILGASLAMATGIMVIDRLTSGLSPYLVTGLAISVGATIYLGTALLLRAEEVTIVRRLMARTQPPVTDVAG